MDALTQTRLREIAARNDPAELAAVVQMLADDTPVDAEFAVKYGFADDGLDRGWYCHATEHNVDIDFGRECGPPVLWIGGPYIRVNRPTRGQLLCLMLALSPGGE